MMAEAYMYQEGFDIFYTPSEAKSAGDVEDLGDFIGVYQTDVEANERGSLRLYGVVNATKKTGEEWAFLDKIYFDADTRSFSNESGYSEAVVGVCCDQDGAAAADVLALVLLLPGVART